MRLAYGEPPNLIMKANLRPHLDHAFFLAYCAPLAVASYFVVACSLWSRFRGSRVAWRELDLVDHYAADVRFLQAERHGEVWMPIELLERGLRWWESGCLRWWSGPTTALRLAPRLYKKMCRHGSAANCWAPTCTKNWPKLWATMIAL